MTTTVTPPVPGSTYQVFPLFQGSPGSPYLLPPNTKYDSSTPIPQPVPAPIAKQIRNVNGPNSGPSSPGCEISDNADFSLAWTADPQNFPVAMLTIKNNNAWKTDSASREALKSSFASFVSELESLELDKGCLGRGGAFLLSQIIAGSMPLSLDETLYYRYGLDKQDRYVDLLPGMRLRVDNAANQFVSPGSVLNGVTPVGATYYEVLSVTEATGNRVIAFDAFLGTISPSDIQPNPQGIAGGIIDLEATGTRRRYYRLVYPTSFSSSVSPGSLSPSQNVTLIGADRLGDLSQATTTFLKSTGASTPSSSGAAQPTLTSFFRGRDIVVPEVPVHIGYQMPPSSFPGTASLQLQRVHVPIGTTVRNLLDMMATTNYPIAGGRRTRDPFPPFKFFREWWPPDVPATQTRWLVEFIPLPEGQFPQGPDVYDLPVVRGDTLSLLFQLP